MTGETISLREYLDRILEEHDKAHASEHKALEIAADNLERRLEGLNQLRQDVITDRGQFVTKDIVAQVLESAAERNDLRDEKTKQLADALEDKTESLAMAMDARIKPLEQQLVTQATLNSIKRIIYTTGFAALLAIGIALYNASRI